MNNKFIAVKDGSWKMVMCMAEKPARAKHFKFYLCVDWYDSLLDLYCAVPLWISRYSFLDSHRIKFFYTLISDFIIFFIGFGLCLSRWLSLSFGLVLRLNTFQIYVGWSRRLLRVSEHIVRITTQIRNTYSAWRWHEWENAAQTQHTHANPLDRHLMQICTQLREFYSSHKLPREFVAASAIFWKASK